MLALVRSWYLSHFLNAICKDVSNDDPFLRGWPQVHLHQDNVVEQHQIAHISHLCKNTNINRGRLLKVTFCVSTLANIKKLMFNYCFKLACSATMTGTLSDTVQTVTLWTIDPYNASFFGFIDLEIERWFQNTWLQHLHISPEIIYYFSLVVVAI